MEQRMGYKKLGRETGNKERENKEQRSETWNRGWDTRNRDVRLGTEGGKQGTET
jgi:hypothetical protein